MMESIGSIIEKFLSDRKILPANPLGDWEDVVGPQIASRARPVKFRKGVLTVHVYDSIWKHHLELHKEEILQKINARAKSEPVTRIVFKVGELPSESKEVSPVSSSRPTKPSKAPRKRNIKPKKYPLSEEAQEFIKNCKDRELKKIAKKLLPLFEPEGHCQKD
ncbi:MAG: DUF721 domain-containing protein [Thermodesulforhabdaceae bacterium]